jgi:TRAP-type mannitol/chloroaromatic compound transport system permease small subunit
MQNLLLSVDRLSTFIGKVFAWTALILTLMISWEVFSRYVLNHPHAWMLDFQIMMYGTLFMTAGAYTLSKNGHVRGDVLYGFFRPRTQATVDLILYFVFFLPGITALTWAGWNYFNEALVIREQTFRLNRYRYTRSSSSFPCRAASCCCRASSRSSAASSAFVMASGRRVKKT